MKNLLTPRGLLIRALVLASLFAALHLAGLRSYTSILCATMPDAGAMQKVDAFLAASYIIAYLLAVVLAPVLAIAAALLAVWNHFTPLKDPAGLSGGRSEKEKAPAWGRRISEQKGYFASVRT